MIRPLTFLAALFLTATAHAQSVALVPPLAGEGVPAAEVQRATAEWLAKHDRRVVDIDPQLVRELEPCLTELQSRPPTCAFDYFKRTQADQAIVTWVERDRAVVAIVIANGLYYSGHARDTSWRVALDKALADARRREVRGLGPWLEVSGFPGDAKVLVDGNEVGRLRGAPVRLGEGGHQVQISAEGYESHYELVNVPTATSYAAVQVELVTESQGVALSKDEPGSSQAVEASASTGRPSLKWRAPSLIAGGSAIALLGVVFVGRGVRVESDNNRSAPWFVAGAVSTAVGAGLLAAGIRIHLDAGPDHASLSMTTAF